MEHESEKTNYVLWIGSFFVVCVFYAAIGLGFVLFYVPDSRAIGGSEAIMLEFALEAQAPDVEEISQEAREEIIAENEIIPEPEPEPEPEPIPDPESIVEPEPEVEPEIIEPTPPSDMVEEVKPVEEIEEQPEPEPKPRSKPQPKPQLKQNPKPEKNKPKPVVKKAEKAQKAKGPDLASPRGQKFAAPQTNRNFGNQGKAIAGWKTKVQRKIAIKAQKFKGQAKVKTAMTATVSFRYDGRGTITSASISRSSGNVTVDEVAVKAVRSASPIPAPPTGQAGSLNVPVRISPQ